MSIQLESVGGKLYINGEEVQVGVVESGSSAEGEWVKFPDGTMICSINLLSGFTGEATSANKYGETAGNVYYANATWNFPAEFVGPPTVVVEGNNVFTYAGSYTYSKSTTSVNVRAFYSGVGNFALQQVDVIAVGRWK